MCDIVETQHKMKERKKAQKINKCKLNMLECNVILTLADEPQGPYRTYSSSVAVQCVQCVMIIIENGSKQR